MKKFATMYLIFYAIAMIGGGIAGFASKHSVPSLIAGVLSGVILLAVYTKIAVDAPRAFQIAAGVAGLLVISMAQRFLKTHHFMPSGLILCLSIIGVIIFILASVSKEA